MNRQPVKDNGSLRPGMFREPIIPIDDLDYQGEIQGPLRLGRDILPMIALMTMQTPTGPRVVQGNADGTIPVSSSGGSEEIVAPPSESASPAIYLATCPAGFTWELLGGSGQYVSSAVVGNRSVRLTFTPSAGGRLFLSLPDALQAAGNSFDYTLESINPSYAQVLGPITIHYVLFPAGLVLQEGDYIFWRDENGIDYAADHFHPDVKIRQKAV